MHITDLAPLLSATSRRDCIWIISPTPSAERGDHGQETPALVLRQRARLRDLDLIADVRVVGLVVRRVLLRRDDVLAVLGVLVAALDENRDGLLHPVARDDAGHGLAVADTHGLLLSRRGAAHRLRPTDSKFTLAQDRRNERDLAAQLAEAPAFLDLVRAGAELRLEELLVELRETFLSSTSALSLISMAFITAPASA